jgi:hypothetical protein
MLKWLLQAGERQAGYCIRASLGLAVVAAALVQPVAHAQSLGWFSLRHHKAASNVPPEGEPAVQPSQPPAFAIPVEPLGFTAPGAYYEGLRESLVSLDFLDENRLLFTFHVPGLMHRSGEDGDERQIRAVVLGLPQGTVEAEALWTLHDHARYVWMLNDGHFLLRDQEDLEQGDSTLQLKPLLRFPGPVLWMEMDPTQQYLVTDSREPTGTEPKAGEVPRPGTAVASVTTDSREAGGQPEIVLRILRRASWQVMLVSHVRATAHLPINSEGYLESLRSTGLQWLLNLNYFTGGSAVVGKVDSSCAPALEFLGQREALVASCNPQGGRWLAAITTDGRHLWNASSLPTQVWPMVAKAPGGSRLAWETLTVSHPVGTFSPLSFDDVKGQLVEVYDGADGKRMLTAPASPVLDGGGNVAISPSGQRVAVLNGGSIQVYELPAPPPLPEGGAGPASP